MCGSAAIDDEEPARVSTSGSRQQTADGIVCIIVIAIMLCICMGKVGIAVGAKEVAKWV